MPDGMSFNCPNCGSALSVNGNEKAIICSYCGSSVIVPDALRGAGAQSHAPLPPEFDLFSPAHVEWLVANGADATVKVDVVKERKGMTYKDNPIFDVMFSGKKADGGKFEAICTINMPANLVPRPGNTLKVKYKKAADPIDDTSDYAIQINGQFVNSVLDNPDDLDGLLKGLM
jgi:DNA-directed RNA polymerase subunit RPC12/RpoP